MTRNRTADLHCHLNGSFSFGFLKRIAERNSCLDTYQHLASLNTMYLERTNTQPKEGYSGEWIKMIWDQFGLIHKIIQNVTDISEGVVDVVESSKAKYLEIRTTPKQMGPDSRDKYIDAFVLGLSEANKKVSNKKAFGILSLDRTIHSFGDAEDFIKRIKNNQYKNLVGLDISGNPVAERTLTGESLRKVINLALENRVPIAIHMGEAESAIEKEDNDIILSELQKWKALQPNQDSNPLHGKVRLGHCIYLTEQQKKLIKELGAPIEICPTCHKKINWHLEKNPHPISSIYEDISDPIVVGTDDEIIFGATTKTELNTMMRFFSNNKGYSKKELKTHQSNFRFGPG